MKKLGRIFATLATLACVAMMSTAVFAGNDDGAAHKDSSVRKAGHGHTDRNAETRGGGNSGREAVEREHDAYDEGSSRNGNGPMTGPAATPLSKLGSAQASTLKTIPVSALGSTMVTVPASSLSTMTPSAIASPPAPAPVAAAPTPTPAPAIDGAALYNSLCAGCHGSGKRGRPAASTQAAISGNLGGMGSLSYLTPAQLQAIAAY